MRQGGFLISKIHQLSGRIFAKKLKAMKVDDINPAQGRILFPLWQNDNISIQELAKKTALGKSTLTRMLDRLEKSGHIKRFFSENDRRKIFIRLTEENRIMKTSYNILSNEMVDLFYKGFTCKEIEQFESYLNRILTNLEEYDQK